MKQSKKSFDVPEFDDFCKTSDVNDIKSINRIRKHIGLREIVRGKVSCLRCGNKFESMDKVNNRVCDICKEDREEIEFASEEQTVSIYK